MAFGVGDISPVSWKTYDPLSTTPITCFCNFSIWFLQCFLCKSPFHEDSLETVIKTVPSQDKNQNILMDFSNLLNYNLHLKLISKPHPSLNYWGGGLASEGTKHPCMCEAPLLCAQGFVDWGFDPTLLLEMNLSRACRLPPKIGQFHSVTIVLVTATVKFCCWRKLFLTLLQNRLLSPTKMLCILRPPPPFPNVVSAPRPHFCLNPSFHILAL